MSYNPSTILSILVSIQNYCGYPYCAGCPLIEIYKVGCDPCPIRDVKRNAYWLADRLRKEIPEKILEDAKVSYNLGEDTSEKDICTET